MYSFDFYGDSWYWSWLAYNNDDNLNIQSHALRNLLRGETGISNPIQNVALHTTQNQTRLDVLGVWFKALGIKHRVFNMPGSNFHDTTKILTDNLNKIYRGQQAAPDWHVVYYSLPVREQKLEDLLLQCKTVSDVKQNIQQMVVNCLNVIGHAAKRSNERVIIFGGHGTLYRHWFESMDDKYKTHVILGSECILTDIVNTYGHPHNATIESNTKLLKLTSSERFTNLEALTPEIINAIYEDYHDFVDPESHKFYTWPDRGHLGYMGQMKFLDMLLAIVEKNK